MKKYAVIGILILVGVLFLNGSITGLFAGGGDYDEFAKCLTENKVVMYGAFWCPHCQNQKDTFGESFDFIEYVECSLPDKSGQTQVCKDKGIKSYPTWDIKGVMHSGELSLSKLSELSGCKLE
jgi:hypothetical protein